MLQWNSHPCFLIYVRSKSKLTLNISHLHDQHQSTQNGKSLFMQRFIHYKIFTAQKNDHIRPDADLQRHFKITTSPTQQEWSQEWSTYTSLTVNRIRYQLILSRDIDNQRILKFDWTRDTLSHTQPKVEFSSAIWMDNKHTWHNLTKEDNLRCYLSLMIISMPKKTLRY